jgi:hypothetical protein
MAKKVAQESGATTTAEAPGKQAPGVNKARAIAEALRALGRDASGSDVVGYVKQKFGVTVSSTYVSIVRGNLKKKRGGRPKKTSVASEQANESLPVRTEPSASAGDFVDLIREVKALANRAGGLTGLKRLVDALAE